jgi:hypothetical protein
MRDEEFTDREQVHNTGKRQGDHEVGSTPIAEVARADGQCQKQDGAEPIHPARRREFHKSPELVRSGASIQSGKTTTQNQNVMSAYNASLLTKTLEERS